MGIHCNLNCEKNTQITYHTITTISNSLDYNLQYTLLKDHYLIAGKQICKFINFNYRRICCKKKYQKMILKLESIFEVESTNFPKKKEYFIELFNKKINFFFENKLDILEEIFPNENILGNLHNFEGLKKMIKNYYANDICYNKINFYNDFFEYVKKKKNLKVFIHNKIEDNINETNRLKSSVKKLMRIQKIFKSDKEKDNVFDSQIEFIEKDIDNLFKLCFLTPIEKLPNKIDDIESENKSYLLMLLSDELKLNTDFFIYGQLRVFVKFFYYLFVLKKFGFLSSTNNLYNKIEKEDFNKVINNKKYYINISDIEAFKLMNKSKIFHSAIYRKNRINSYINSQPLFFEEETNISNKDNEEFDFDMLKENNIYNINKVNTEEFIKTDSINYYPILTDNMINQSHDNSHEIKRVYTMKKLTRGYLEEDMNFSPIKGKHMGVSRVNSILKSDSLDRKSFFHSKPRGGKLSHINFIDNIGHNNTLNLNENQNNNKIELYNGEFDKTIYLYAGIGILIKPRNSSLYHGTFRYGIKEGFGIYYRQLSEYHFKYYMGEFTHNKFDGFGFLIELNYRYGKISKGFFHNSHFISGIVVTFKENNHDTLEVTKYEGELEESNINYIIYKNYGHLIKVTYGMNKNKTKYEKIDEYDYTGYFSEGKENGEGYLKHTLKSEGYSYEYRGNFLNGEINGYGIIEYSDNFFIKKYEGFFDGNGDKSFSNYGIVHFKSGDIYEGFFDEKHLKSLCGLYWHFNSNKNLGNDNYFGGFCEDMKNGFGRYISYNDKYSKLLIGTYLRGDKSGLFQLIYEEEKDEQDIGKSQMSFEGVRKTFGQLIYGNQKLTKCYLLIQKKKYYVFEDGELMEKSDKKIKSTWINIFH